MHGHHDHSHAHEHGHPEGPDAHLRAQRALLVSLALNGGFLLVEAGVGAWTGSLALLSDAAHMVSDVGALALALGATLLARRPTMASRTFGWRRAEVMGGFVNALALLAACGIIAWEALERMRAGAPALAGVPVLIVGVLGLLINLGSAAMLARADREDLNIRAALAHMLADALGSLGAIAAAVGIMLGFPLADPLISLFIAGLVLWGAWGLLRDTAAVLLQFPPRGVSVEALRHELEAVEGVLSVHDLRVWTLDGRGAILSAHLVAEEPASAAVVLDRANARLRRRPEIQHVTLQVDPGRECAWPLLAQGSRTSQ